MDGPSVAGGQARQLPTSAHSASDPSRLVSSDVALCPTGKNNDGFNEGPLNHVTVDLANKKKKKRPRRRPGGDARKHQTARRSLGFDFHF